MGAVVVVSHSLFIYMRSQWCFQLIDWYSLNGIWRNATKMNTIRIRFIKIVLYVGEISSCK